MPGLPRHRLHCFRDGLLQQGWQVSAGSAELRCNEVPSPEGLRRTGRVLAVRERRRLRDLRLPRRAVPTNVHAIRQELQGIVRLSDAPRRTVRQVCRWDVRDSGVYWRRLPDGLRRKVR